MRRVSILAAVFFVFAAFTSLVTTRATGQILTPSDPVITSGPDDPTNSQAATFDFTGDPAVTFRCKLDDGSFANCTSPETYSGLTEGSHTFSVKAVDALENESGVDSHDWTIDLTDPTTSLTAKPDDPSNDSSPSFSFTSSDGGASFQCKLDDGSFASCTSPETYSGLPDGAHTFTVRARDAAGNADPSPVSYTWTIDTSAPNTLIDTQPSDPSSSASASFTFHSSQAGSTFTCKLDGGSFLDCTSPESYASLGDGSHTFTVRATDAAGNTDPSPPTYTWRVDTGAPTATITDNPPLLDNSDSPSFSFTSSDGSVTFECKRDTGSYAACDSPKAYSGLADGSHTFTVRATDAAGNTDTASYTWTIDTAAPTASITAKPTDPSNDTSPSFSFTSSEGGSTFDCKLDADSFVSCTSPKGYPSLTDGSYTIIVRARDAAGNTGTAAYTWTVDASAPNTAIDTQPANPTNSTSASFTFHSSQTGSTFRCKLDAGSFAVCPSPKSYTGLGSGSHTFSVEAIDPARNTDPTPAIYTWTIDTAAPTASITAKPTNPSNVTSPSFSFTSSDGSASFQCKLDAFSFAACISPQTYSGLADDSHTFTVRATDAAGNVGTASYTWVVDLVPPPPPTIDSGPPALTDSTAVFAFSDSEGGTTFLCSLNNAPFAACSSPKSYAGLANGLHTLDVEAKDAAGNESFPTSRTWTLDTTAPSVGVSSPANGSATSDRTPDISGTADTGLADRGEVSVKVYAGSSATGSPLQTLGVAASSGAWSITYPSSLVTGTYSVQAQQTDGFGRTGTSNTNTFRIDRSAPSVTLARPRNAALTKNPQPRFSGTAGLAEGDLPTVTVEIHSGSTAAGPLVDTLTVDAAPDGTWAIVPATALADGRYAALAKQSDTAGVTGTSSVHTFAIDTVAPSPLSSATVRRGYSVVSVRWTRGSDWKATDMLAIYRRVAGASRRSLRTRSTGSSWSDKRVKNGVTYQYDLVPLDRAGNRAAPTSRNARPTGFLSPKHGATVPNPPGISWVDVANSTYSNIQIWNARVSVKMLSVWPKDNGFTLRSRWTYRGHVYRLRAGRTYRIYGWPGFGSRSAARYGKSYGWVQFTYR